MFGINFIRRQEVQSLGAIMPSLAEAPYCNTNVVFIFLVFFSEVLTDLNSEQLRVN